MDLPKQIKYRGLFYVRADAFMDAQDRERAQRVVQWLKNAVSSAGRAENLGWKRGERSGLPYWSYDITSMLETDVPVEIRLVNYGYMEKFVDFLGGAGAALDRSDPERMVLVANLVDRDGNLKWHDASDRKYVLHELIHAIDYSRKWDEIKDKETAPLGSQQYREDPDELRAYFAMGVEEMIREIQEAYGTPNRQFLDKPGSEWMFWKYSVGFDDWPSFQQWAEYRLEPKWFHRLGDEGKRWVERKLMELWEYWSKEFNIKGK